MPPNLINAMCTWGFLMQLLIDKYTSYPGGVIKGQPQIHGQSEVKFLKRENEGGIKKQHAEVVTSLN